MNKTWYVYIIRCDDSSLYTGISTDPVKRLETHKKGKGAKYLRGRTGLKLVYIEMVISKSQALKRELEIKKYNKNQKLKLIASNESSV